MAAGVLAKDSLGFDMADIVEQLVTTPPELAACCEHLASCGRFGLDTEFVGEESYHPRLCLVQVATSEALFIIDPFVTGPLDRFWQEVVNPANQVIMHAGREELRLCRLWSGQAPANWFDLQIAAGLAGFIYPLGHGSLVHQILDVQLTKGETLTEWRHRPLTPAQIRYALDDVRYLLPAWQRLHDQLDQLGRLAWATEEFQRVAAQVTPEEPGNGGPMERWRKLRGLGSLDRRRLAVVRELYYWREQQAAEANRPTRSLLRDDLIVEIARRNPSRERDLHVVRGLAKRHAPGIMEAIDRGRRLPLEQCPAVTEREQDPPQLGLIVNVLQAVLADFCTRQQLAANLVSTNADLKSLVRSFLQQQPPAADLLLNTGWRAQYVLPHLQAVLDGRRALRIANVSAEAPFAYQDL